MWSISNNSSFLNLKSLAASLQHSYSYRWIIQLAATPSPPTTHSHLFPINAGRDVEVEGSSYQLQPTTGRCLSTRRGVIRSAQDDKRSCFHHRCPQYVLYVTWNGSGVQPLVYWPVSGWIQIRWHNYINKWTFGEDVCPKIRYSNIFLCIKLHLGKSRIPESFINVIGFLQLYQTLSDICLELINQILFILHLSYIKCNVKCFTS